MSEQLDDLQPIDYVHPDGTRATIRFTKKPTQKQVTMRISVQFIDSDIVDCFDETVFISAEESRRRGMQLATDSVNNWKQ